MKLLVTGGAGYIGSTVATLLLEAGHEVVVLDDLSTGYADAVPAGARFVEGRVHDVAGDVITKDAAFDGVLHFAAYIAAGESVSAPEKYWENNVVGSLRLLDAIRAAGVPRLVFSSTANIYGSPAEQPIGESSDVAGRGISESSDVAGRGISESSDVAGRGISESSDVAGRGISESSDVAGRGISESSVAAPPNPYATSKLAVEYAITGDAGAHGLAAVSLRYFNAAGALIRAEGSRGERHDPETHLIPNALLVAAGERENLSLFGDDYPTPDGTCVRDYIHIEDLASAHLLALDAIQPGEHRLYNLGNGTGFSNLEVIDAVRAVTGHPVPVKMAPRRPGDPAVLVASSAKARAELGWSPTRANLSDIITDAWTFARSRRHLA